jgi:8-oxo-dGTP diphosphatase
MTSLHVTVAVIINTKQEVLIALRQVHQHQGGLWEFPGGKVEAGEATCDALKREIKEELDLAVVSARPLLEVTHDYDDKSVLLDVWYVSEYAGEARGVEGQTIRWCAVSDLDTVNFPEANKTIINAINALPI